MEFNEYITKQPRTLKAVQITPEIREVLIEKGYTNVWIGDMYCIQPDGTEHIIGLERFKRLMVPVKPLTSPLIEDLIGESPDIA